MVNKVDFSSIEVLARMTNTEIQCKELVDKWLLLTYDIPVSEEGNRARSAFLHQAYMLGASRHTDSVYLMPWTASAEALALELARSGEVCVWTSQTTDKAKAQEITKTYDEALEPMLDEIGGRIDRIEEHIYKKRRGQAAKMMKKTEQLLNSAKGAIIRRGSAQLYVMITLLERRFNALII